jgi:hypothetical protein
MEKVLADLATDRDLLLRMRLQGTAYARERLTWEAKARDTTRVLRWVMTRVTSCSLATASAWE